MKLNPVSLLWVVLRNNETAARPVIFEFHWPHAKWNSEIDSEEDLALLRTVHGPPQETRLIDKAMQETKPCPSTTSNALCAAK